MPLPNYIKDTFEWINPTTTLDNDYCGAYNSLLRRAFPIEDGYMINPQVAETISSHDDEFVMYFRVEFHRTIVFFAEVGTAIAIKDSSARATADDQTRLRLSQLSDKGLTELHGMSALGTRLRFYRSACLDGPTKSLTPPSIYPIHLNDIAPADHWDVDIMTEDGYDHFMSLAARVRALAVVEAHKA